MSVLIKSLLCVWNLCKVEYNNDKWPHNFMTSWLHYRSMFVKVSMVIGSYIFFLSKCKYFTIENSGIVFFLISICILNCDYLLNLVCIIAFMLRVTTLYSPSSLISWFFLFVDHTLARKRVVTLSLLKIWCMNCTQLQLIVDWSNIYNVISNTYKYIGNMWSLICYCKIHSFSAS